MPHAITDMVDTRPQSKLLRRSKGKSSSRDKHQLSALLEDYQSAYYQSQLSQTISKQLQMTLRNSSTPITRILSLGLGSLNVTKGQSRRLKQLVILLAIQDTLQHKSKISIAIYAQDPTFTHADEAFLSSLGISILRTPSGSELGEAASVVSASTLVYSPFLTLEAYEQMFVHAALPVKYLVGDDFNALLSKWPKHSAERAQVEGVVRFGLSAFRRRAISGDGFWIDSDETFPMAIYGLMNEPLGRRGKARL